MDKRYADKEEIRERFRVGNDLKKISVIPAYTETQNAESKTEKNVVVYCRVSTDGITQTTSFELQKKYYIKYVKEHEGWRLKALYSDEGISATSVNHRKGLIQMISDAKEGKIDIIITKSISRFSRNLLDSVHIVEELRSLPKPVSIYFETEGMDSLDPRMDFILKVLALVAEEESRKKSEAITSSYRQRFEEGFFNVPDSLGYQKNGVNSIEIDEEEAKTVRLIYQMFLAEYEPDEAASILRKLGRKKHSHVYPDGRVQEGNSDWSGKSVLNVLDNEKRCGDVLAQKTYTPNCLEHNSRKNNHIIKQYYGIDQHDAIISREMFYLAQKVKNANKGGWKYGRQILNTHISGPLRGFVNAIPDWLGYTASDYNRASLAAYNIDIPKEEIYPDYVVNNTDSFCTDNQYQESYVEISEEEFNCTPVLSEEELSLLRKDDVNFLDTLQETRDKTFGIQTTEEKTLYTAGYEQFSLTEKIIVILDRYGMKIGKNGVNKLAAKNGFSSFMAGIKYNPLRQELLLFGVKQYNPAENVNIEKRFRARGLCDAIFTNMGWNRKYKYKLVGEIVHIENDVFLRLDLEEAITVVTVREIQKKDFDTKQKDDIEPIMKEALFTGEFYADESGRMSEYADYIIGKVENRSRAIYFENEKSEIPEKVRISDCKDEKYHPEFVEYLLSRKIEPEEGWNYLNGKVRFTQYGFELFPQRKDESRRYEKSENAKDQEDCVVPMGWVTQFSFPTRDDVEKTIAGL